MFRQGPARHYDGQMMFNKKKQSKDQQLLPKMNILSNPNLEIQVP